MAHSSLHLGVRDIRLNLPKFYPCAGTETGLQGLLMPLTATGRNGKGASEAAFLLFPTHRN